MIESPLERVQREAFERGALQLVIDVADIRSRGCLQCRGPLGPRYLYCSEACSVASRAENRK
jgi:hypothetical protein